jgi:hypothetical protein
VSHAANLAVVNRVIGLRQPRIDLQPHESRQTSFHLESLEKQKAAVRNDLEQLRAGPSNKRELQSWIDFGKEDQKEASASGTNGEWSENRVDSTAKSGSVP